MGDVLLRVCEKAFRTGVVVVESLSFNGEIRVRKVIEGEPTIPGIKLLGRMVSKILRGFIDHLFIRAVNNTPSFGSFEKRQEPHVKDGIITILP